MRKVVTAFAAGVLTGMLIMWLVMPAWGRFWDVPQVAAPAPDGAEMMAQTWGQEEAGSGRLPETHAADSGHKIPYQQWDRAQIYLGGDEVAYNGRVYRAKWWTQGEEPGQADVWQDTLKSAGASVEPKNEDEPSQDKPEVLEDGSFKVVGYYPDWKPAQTDKLRYDVLTHVVYAFAIPTLEGGLRPLENPQTAKSIIESAHQKGVKVLIAVGGWSYNDTPLEATFMEATATEDRTETFSDAIVELCLSFGFDGVDMDWEHPRVDGSSAAQYEALMLSLSEKLHAEGKLLTSAVISGATADGGIYYDAAAHSDAVLDAVDWINVMAYDGGDGERHSAYDFAVNCGQYWRNERQMIKEKVVLGVPFYGRPGWASYEDMLAANSSAWQSDVTMYNGMEAHYNGAATIGKKTEYARSSLGGIMIWEITQDTADREKSLMSAISEALK